MNNRTVDASHPLLQLLVAFLPMAAATSQVFLNSQSIAVPASSYCVEMSDLDGDGDLDVVDGVSGQLRIHRNVAGVLQSVPLILPCSGSPFDLVVGDWNGDDRPDIAACGLSGSVDVYLANGAGSWARSSYVLASACYYLVAADFNGDGYLDLATSNYGGTTAIVGLNQGAPSPGVFSWLSYSSGGAEPVGITAGDWDADGDIDLAISHYYHTPNLSLLLNNGSGTGFVHVVAHNGSAGIAGYQIVSGDFDGVGNLDIAMAASTGQVQVFYNPSPASVPWTAQPLMSQPSGYAVGIDSADIDGDGSVDLVHSYGGGAAGGTYVYLNRGTAAWPVTRLGSGPTWQTAIADVDGDGRRDFVVHDNAAGALVHWRNMTPAPATAPFGVGTFGTLGVAPTTSEPPRLGTTIHVGTAGVPGNQLSLLVIGFEIPGGQPLAPGVVLYGQGATRLGTTNMGGALDIPLTLPNSTGLAGMTMTAQFFVLDPPANPLGVAATRPLRLFPW